jgi:hypothetical protein
MTIAGITRAATAVALTLGALAFAGPASAQATPPVTCNAYTASFFVGGSASAPVLVADSYYSSPGPCSESVAGLARTAEVPGSERHSPI